jgi:hypothetical protein
MPEDTGAPGLELGTTGLKQSGGIVREEWLQELVGTRGRRALAEMRDNDSIVGASLYTLAMLVRGVEWRTAPAEQDAEEDDRAEFAESLRSDMSHSWDDLIGEIMAGMPVFGFSPHEIVYKRRAGETDEPGTSSHYTDGLLGWRKLPVRAQESVERWVFDEDDGGLAGLVQRVDGKGAVPIPIEKLLLFRTSTAKGNPEGRSALRNAYRSWFLKKRIEDIEAVGIERDLAGIPVMWLPGEYLSPAATAADLQAKQEFEVMGRQLRADEQSSVLMPLSYDENGNKRFDLTLLGSPGGRQFDTAPVLERYSTQIAMTMLTDVILLGHEQVGTQALSVSKVGLLAQSLDTWLQNIASVFNAHALPRLFKLNGLPTDNMPRYVPGSVAPSDVAEKVQMLAALAQAGAPLFPSPDLEAWLAEEGGWPTPVEQAL